MTTKQDLLNALEAQVYAVLKEERVLTGFPLLNGMARFKITYLASMGDSVLPSSAEIIVKDFGLPSEEAKWLGGSPIQQKNTNMDAMMESVKKNNGTVIKNISNGILMSIMEDDHGEMVETYKFVDLDAEKKERVRPVKSVITSNVI
jgi:hypothetical protein